MTTSIRHTTGNAIGLMATGIPAACLQNTRRRIKAVTKTVNVAIGRGTSLPVPCEFWATPDMDDYAYDCVYDPKQISLADAEKWVRTQLDQQDVHVAQFINEDEPDDDTRLTYRAVAVYLANELYAQALTQDDPAATLDDIANDLPEVMTETFKETGTNAQMAAVLLPELVDRVWAFTVVAHARADAEDGYEYVFDLMADALRSGGNAKTIRAEVPRVVEKLRASRITARIWEARDAADGPWAQILDIVLGAIEKGADPQAVIDQTLGLMERVRSEKPAA